MMAVFLKNFRRSVLACKFPCGFSDSPTLSPLGGLLFLSIYVNFSCNCKKREEEKGKHKCIHMLCASILPPTLTTGLLLLRAIMARKEGKKRSGGGVNQELLVQQPAVQRDL